MQAAWLRSLVAVGVSLVASVQAQAQPLFGYAESIETTVANADLVLIGRIAAFDGGKPADERGEHEVTIDIEESLKEPIFTVESHRKLRVRVTRPASVLAGWKARSSRLLVATDDCVPGATTVIELAVDKLEILTADFRLLRDPEAVIQAAKGTLRRMPASVRRTHIFGLEVPREAIAGTRWQEYYETGGYLILSVPVEERLEKRAHDYIRSESYRKREEGVRALRYFKTDENIARARTLLNDPGWAYMYHAQENKGIGVRIYGVRQEAYRTLKSWGMDVEKPMIREEVRE
jgi:hypothetical protein